MRERGANRQLNSSYIEQDHGDGSDDDGAISLNAIKNKFKNNSKLSYIPALKIRFIVDLYDL